MIREWRNRRHIERFGHKNKGYFNYFTFGWFKKHQKILLFLLNAPVIRIWFRWAMRMHNDKEVKGKRIASFEPNGYRIKLNDSEMQYVVRTHAKYSKRVYYSFWAVWWAMHWVDMATRALLPHPFAETVNFGFDTLTVYPDADPEVNSVDGDTYSNNNDVSWAVGRGSAGYAPRDSLTAAGGLIQTGAVTDTYDDFFRVHLGFDLTAPADITSASVNTYIISIYDGLFASNSIRLVTNTATWTTALSASDHSISNFDAQVSSDKDLSSTSVGWNSFDLNAAGLAHIATGLVRFGMLAKEDHTNSEGTWVGTSDGGVLISTSESANDPYLSIIYSTASGGQSQMVI